MRWLRRLMRALALLVVVAIVAVAALIASIEYGCRPSAADAAASATPAFTVNLPGYRRDRGATFFTFPGRYSSPISAAATCWCARRATRTSPRSRWRSPAPAA